MQVKKTKALTRLRTLSNRIRIVRGGTSAGKTICILLILIDYAIRNEGKQISVVSESIPHLRRGALKDFLGILKGLNRYKDSQFNKSTLKYTFTNGSYIEFFSTDSPDRLRGARRTDLYINECNNIPFDAYQQANWWRVYGLGEVGSLEGVCIPDWKEIDAVPQDARLLSYGMDFGYSVDPTTLIALYKWNDAYIYDEVLYKKGMLNRDISRFLQDNNITENIIADSAEPKSIAELTQYGHNVYPVSKGRDSVVYGINLINQNEIYVTSRSKNLKRELQGYIWAKDKEGNTLQKPTGAHPDCIDAARYVLTDQLENPNKGQYFVY